MSQYSVQRFRAAMMQMYLRIALAVALPMSILCWLFLDLSGKGLALLAFALFALWLEWRHRSDSVAMLRYVDWFVLALLALIFYGTHLSGGHMRHEVWMLIFPIVAIPLVEPRERMIWITVAATSFGTVMLLRPEPLSLLASLMYLSVYLVSSLITLMLVRHNEQNIERLAHLSIVDPLTGVYNRGHLKEVLSSELNRCRRSGQPLTVIMLDIDHFKGLNDSYGHLYGDQVLERVADALRQAAQRAGDHVFRYGGEEFCILSSGLRADESKQFAQRICSSISSLEIENRAAPLRRLTASAGFCCVADLSEVTVSSLLLNADNALYRAKEAGRNAVVDFAEIAQAGAGESGRLQGAPV